MSRPDKKGREEIGTALQWIGGMCAILLDPVQVQKIIKIETPPYHDVYSAYFIL